MGYKTQNKLRFAYGKLSIFHKVLFPQKRQVTVGKKSLIGTKSLSGFLFLGATSLKVKQKGVG